MVLSLLLIYPCHDMTKPYFSIPATQSTVYNNFSLPYCLPIYLLLPFLRYALHVPASQPYFIWMWNTHRENLIHFSWHFFVLLINVCALKGKKEWMMYVNAAQSRIVWRAFKGWERFFEGNLKKFWSVLYIW